jgi:hypothetical protein
MTRALLALFTFHLALFTLPTMAHEIFIKLDGDAFTVHSVVACTGSAPTHTRKQLSPYELKVAFCTSGAAAALADYKSASIALKRKDRYTAASTVTSPFSERLLSVNATVSGSGSTTRYEFTMELNSVLIADDMGKAASVEYDAEISWIKTGSLTPFKASNFTIVIEAAVLGEEETQPGLVIKSNRVIYVDQNWAQFSAQGFPAYANLQDAMDAAFALSPVPSFNDPVTIKIGNLIAGDAEITATTAWSIIIEGIEREASEIGDVIIHGGYGGTLTLKNLECGDWTYDTAGASQTVRLVNTAIDKIVAQAAAQIAVTGDVLSTLGTLDANGTAGTAGTAATGGAAATAGGAGTSAAPITVQGSLRVNTINGIGGAGGVGGAGDATQQNGAAGGAGGNGAELSIFDFARVGTVNIRGGAGGAGGAGHTNGNGGNGGAGGNGTLIYMDAQTRTGLTTSITGGDGGAGGLKAGTGTNGTAGANGTAAAQETFRALSVTRIGVAGFSIPANRGGLYLDATDRLIYYTPDGEEIPLSGALGATTVVTGDEIEFPLSGGGTGYIPFFRR